MLLAAGLLLLIQGRAPERHAASLIDALIVSSGLGLLAWISLIAPYANDPTLTTLQRGIVTGYPVLAVLLLAVVARLATGPGARSPAFWAISGATVVLLAAESAYGYIQLNGVYTTGGFIDLGRLAFYAPGVLALQGVRQQPIDAVVISAASAVLFLLVVARMVGLVRRLRQQSSQLTRLARTDGLTGIANRRVWDEMLPIAPCSDSASPAAWPPGTAPRPQMSWSLVPTPPSTAAKANGRNRAEIAAAATAAREPQLTP